MIEKVTQLVNTIQKEMLKWYHDLHQIPEVSHKEFATKQYLIRVLSKNPQLIINDYNTDSLVAILNDDSTLPLIVIRCDMDALPIMEATGLTYASRHQGIMHACGHDAHMSIVLGVMQTLMALKVTFPVAFLFQAAEETGTGARQILQSAFFQRPIKCILGLHVDPLLDISSVQVEPLALFAKSCEFTLVSKGRSTHGATPQLGIDANVLASKWLIKAKKKHLPGILSVGIIKGGHANNIIADKCRMQGIIRSFQPLKMEKIKKWMEKSSKRIARKMDGTIAISFHDSCPVLMNNHQLVNVLHNLTKKMAVKHVKRLGVMYAEDFAYYTQKYPCLFYLLGAKPKDEPYPLHSPQMHINEEALLIGVLLQTLLIVNISKNSRFN